MTIFCDLKLQILVFDFAETNECFLEVWSVGLTKISHHVKDRPIFGFRKILLDYDLLQRETGIYKLIWGQRDSSKWERCRNLYLCNVAHDKVELYKIRWRWEQLVCLLEVEVNLDNVRTQKFLGFLTFLLTNIVVALPAKEKKAIRMTSLLNWIIGAVSPSFIWVSSS